MRGPALVHFPLLISSSLFASWQGHPPGKALGKLEVLEVIVDRELWAVLGYGWFIENTTWAAFPWVLEYLRGPSY